jgi:predicted transcriptional regulator
MKTTDAVATDPHEAGDIQYHLYVRAKVERGIRAIDEGRFVPQEEAERRVQEWLKSSGRSQP